MQHLFHPHIVWVSMLGVLSFLYGAPTKAITNVSTPIKIAAQSQTKPVAQAVAFKPVENAQNSASKSTEKTLLASNRDKSDKTLERPIDNLMIIENGKTIYVSNYQANKDPIKNKENKEQKDADARTLEAIAASSNTKSPPTATTNHADTQKEIQELKKELAALKSKLEHSTNTNMNAASSVLATKTDKNHKPIKTK